MIVEIKMISIGTTKITPKNRSELVFFGCVDRKRPVLGGPVRSPQYLGRSWTGCGPRLRVLGTKNRTEPDLKTLVCGQPEFCRDGGWFVSFMGGRGSQGGRPTSLLWAVVLTSYRGRQWLWVGVLLVIRGF
jgi:hypothetical protein